LQQQTISLRISEALRTRLERAKEILSSKTGESVSTSEVAKQILEAARGDRFEVAELMENPSEALLQIRKKGEAQHILSRPSGYCWRTLCRGTRNLFRQDAEPGLQRISHCGARRVPGRLRTEDGTCFHTRPYYVSNLPSECRPAKAKGPEESEHATPDIVRRTVAETRKRLSDSAVKWTPSSQRAICMSFWTTRNFLGWTR